MCRICSVTCTASARLYALSPGTTEKKILIGISETHCSLSTSAVTRVQSSTSAGDLRVVKVDDGLRYVIECEEADAGGVPGAPGNASMDDETL